MLASLSRLSSLFTLPLLLSIRRTHSSLLNRLSHPSLPNRRFPRVEMPPKTRKRTLSNTSADEIEMRLVMEEGTGRYPRKRFRFEIEEEVFDEAVEDEEEAGDEGRDSIQYASSPSLVRQSFLTPGGGPLPATRGGEAGEVSTPKEGDDEPGTQHSPSPSSPPPAPKPKKQSKPKVMQYDATKFLPRVKSPWKVGAHVSASGGVENAVVNAAMIGANAFALFLKSQRKWTSPPLTPSSIALFKQRMDELDYDCKHVLPHGSYLINLGNPDKYVSFRLVSRTTYESATVTVSPFFLHRFTLYLHPSSIRGSFASCCPLVFRPPPFTLITTLTPVQG
ncbi:hypothetical protein NMY22_g4962 [Coprinellus aureogranulatus]|nr:hypothetical protein NMY22_g4962 [Coprinellus aureogranulatus]